MFSAQTVDNFLEIFSPTGKDPLKNLTIRQASSSKKSSSSNNGNITRVYDRSVKGYLISIEKEDKSHISITNMGLHQSNIYFQLFLFTPDKHVTIEMYLVDAYNQKFRLHFSTKFREYDKVGLHFPLVLPSGGWCTLLFDLKSILLECRNATFLYIDSFILHPSCLLRKIFSSAAIRRNMSENCILINPLLDYPIQLEATQVLIDTPLYFKKISHLCHVSASMTEPISVKQNQRYKTIINADEGIDDRVFVGDSDRSKYDIDGVENLEVSTGTASNETHSLDIIAANEVADTSIGYRYDDIDKESDSPSLFISSKFPTTHTNLLGVKEVYRSSVISKSISNMHRSSYSFSDTSLLQVALDCVLLRLSLEEEKYILEFGSAAFNNIRE